MPRRDQSFISIEMSRFIRSFYNGFIENETEVMLGTEESHHLSRVLRREVGDQIELLDGKGTVARGECIEITNKSIWVRVSSVQRAPLFLPEINMSIALTKGGKWEDLIKPLTELGVHQITPLITERTEVKVGMDNFNKKKKKYEKLAIEGCKQSGNPWLPKIDDPQEYESYLSACNQSIYMATLTASNTGLHVDTHLEKFDLLIGPEGGWTDKEEKLAIDSGVIFYSLATTTLRAETAAVSSLAVARNQFLD